VDGKHEDNLAELSVPGVRSDGVAKRALDRRIRRFGHPTLGVVAISDEGVVADGGQRGSTVVNQRLDAMRVELVFGVPVLEAVVSGDGMQASALRRTTCGPAFVSWGHRA